MYAFSWLTCALRTVTPAQELANSILLLFTILAITSGSDHLNNNLPVIFWALELTSSFLYITVSPTLNRCGLRSLLNLFTTLLQAALKFQ